MNGLFLYKNYSLDSLADNLIQILIQKKSQLTGDSELIICQNQAIKKWLSLTICNKAETFAAVKFTNLHNFIYNAYFNISENVNSNFLTAIIKSLLDSYIRNDKLPDYFKNRFNQTIDLAIYIEDLFSQYAVYRPNVLHEWIADKNSYPNLEWQKNLFIEIYNIALKDQKIKEIIPWFDLIHHKKYDYIKNVKQYLKKNNIKKVSLFSFSQIPPLFLDILQKMSKDLQINIFTLNPSLGYWWNKDLIEINNELLTRLGKSSGNFNKMIESTNYDFFENENENFNYEEENLLSSLKENIFYSTNEEIYKLNDDSSLQIYGVNSQSRELELVKNQIINLFIDKNEKLDFGKVAIMAPDINVYKHLIPNIFSYNNENLRLPYSIADTDSWLDNPCIKTFFKLITTITGRFTLNDIFSLLDDKVLQIKFNLPSSDLDLVENWLKSKNLIWGISSEFKENLLKVSYHDQSSWETSFKELIDSFIFNQDDFKEITGGNTNILGNIMNFCDMLFYFNSLLQENHSLKKLESIFKNILKDFLSQPENTIILEHDEVAEQDYYKNFHKGYTKLLQIIHEIDLGCEKFPEYQNDEISADQLMIWIINFLNQPIENSFKFYTNKINFSSLKPLRSIPFDYIFLIGMNDSVFPRKQNKNNLNLMNEEYKYGDPDPEESDNYLFLETLLSAKKQFFITYLENEKDYISRPVEILKEYVEKYAHYDFTKNSVTEPDFIFNQNNNLVSYSQKSKKIANILSNKSDTKISPDRILNIILSINTTTPIDNNNNDLNDLVKLLIEPLKYLVQNMAGLFPASKKYTFFSEQMNPNNECLSVKLNFIIIPKIKKLIQLKKISFLNNNLVNLNKLVNSSGNYQIENIEQMIKQSSTYFKLFENICSNTLQNKVINNIKVDFTDYYQKDNSLVKFLNKSTIDNKTKLTNILLLELLKQEDSNITDIIIVSLTEQKTVSISDNNTKFIIQKLCSIINKESSLYPIFNFDHLTKIKSDDFSKFEENLIKTIPKPNYFKIKRDYSNLIVFLENNIQTSDYIKNIPPENLKEYFDYYQQVILPTQEQMKKIK